MELKKQRQEYVEWKYVEPEPLFGEINYLLEKYGSVLPKMEFAPDIGRAVSIRMAGKRVPFLIARPHNSNQEVFYLAHMRRPGGIWHPYANHQIFETVYDEEQCLMGKYPEVGNLLYYLDYYFGKAHLLFPSAGLRAELLLPEGELREKVASLTEKTSPAQYYPFLASLAEQHVDKFHIQLLGPPFDEACEFFNASELDPIHVYLSRKGDQIRILRTGRKPLDLFLKDEPGPISV